MRPLLTGVAAGGKLQYYLAGNRFSLLDLPLPSCPVVSSMSFDIEKMNKLPVEARFFDVNEIWYFMNRWVVRLLYPTSVTPNQITVLSLVFGLASAGFLCFRNS